MVKRNSADGVVGLPDRYTGSRADHLLDDGVSILWFIEYRLWVGSFKPEEFRTPTAPETLQDWRPSTFE